MIEQAKKDFLIDMNNSIYIGDSQVDYLLAKHFNLTFMGLIIMVIMLKVIVVF